MYNARMLSERTVSYHPDEQVVVEVEDNFHELRQSILPLSVEFLDAATFTMLTVLSEALVVYHNAPIIVLRTESRMERKRQMMAFSSELSSYLDQSKLRYNHIYGIRMAINVILQGVSSSSDKKALELGNLLQVLDDLFFVNGNHPNEYPGWNIDDQLLLALMINPEVEKTVRGIEDLCN